MKWLLLFALVIHTACHASDFSFINPGLDARFEGVLKIEATAGQTNKFYYYFTEDVYFNGVETYCFNSNNFDAITLEVQYQAAPGLWYRYKKFGKKYYVAPKTLQKNIVFPTKPKAGLRVEAEYVFGVSAPATAACMVNMFKFTDIEYVNPLMGQQGEDW